MFADGAPRPTLFPELEDYLGARRAEASRIGAARRPLLRELGRYARRAVGRGDTARLLFVCTHNARRSQLAQAWALVASRLWGLDGVETYSGGTEVTRFEPRAVAALERAGFRVRMRGGEPQPRYRLRWAPAEPAIEAFSKKIAEAPNPPRDYCAVMTCDDASEACPVLPGAAERLAVSYEDPRLADGLPDEQSVYDARCAQIAREMLFAFSPEEGP